MAVRFAHCDGGLPGAALMYINRARRCLNPRSSNCRYRFRSAVAQVAARALAFYRFPRAADRHAPSARHHDLGGLTMRVLKTLGLSVAAVALLSSAALACNGSRVSADSGQITIATGPQPITPQTPIKLPEED